MKKNLCLFLFFLVVSVANAQVIDTLLGFYFNVPGTNSATYANAYNIGNTITRESSFSSNYSYPTNGTGYTFATDGWVNGLSNQSGYYVQFSSLQRSHIIVSSKQKSSTTGPKKFILQYKVGATSIWSNVSADTIRCANSIWIGLVNNVELPSECDFQPVVYLRWLVVSNANTSGGIIDAAGTSEIDEINIVSLNNDVGDFLDINQIKAKINSGGINFTGGTGDNMHAEYEYPIDSNKNTIFCSSLWIGGKYQNELFLGADIFHLNGRDFNPGPVMDTSNYSNEFFNWNKVWKISKSEIDYHMAHWNTTGYVVPASISQWPVYANPALGINYYLAPFVDADSSGSYNPVNGDYPEIRGDQAIYFIFNDSVAAHSETGGKRMGVEVHGLAYAYNSIPLLDKTIFVNYLIYNRSPRTYDSVYIGLFTDIDLGYPKDDYIGCDTSFNTYYCYNGDNYDETAGGYNGYGINAPVQAVTFLSTSMTSFMCSNNSGVINPISVPDSAYNFYNFMKATWQDGTHLHYGGNGSPGNGGVGPLCNFVFPGYPYDTTQWNEISVGNPPFDRRGVGATGPINLLSGDYISMDIAYILIDSLGGNGVVSNVNSMYSVVPQIIDFFHTNLPQNGSDLALSVDEPQTEPDFSTHFKVFPNPAQDKITVASEIVSKNSTIEIFDMNGRLLQSLNFNSVKKEINISDLKEGVYVIKITNQGKGAFFKFVKM
jgi:hypothetical protein